VTKEMSMTAEVLHDEIEKFQTFVFEMDDVLELFVKEAAVEGTVLDYSIEGLGSLEKYIDKHYVQNDENLILKNRSSRYLGEVFRKNFGGIWDLYIDNEKDLHYLLPVITKYSDIDIDFCPIAIISNYMRKKKRGLLKGAVMADKEFLKNKRAP
jgi:hypothetical protein